MAEGVIVATLAMRAKPALDGALGSVFYNCVLPKLLKQKNKRLRLLLIGDYRTTKNWKYFLYTQTFKIKEKLFWEQYYSALREPKVRSAVPHSEPQIQKEITRDLNEHNFNVKNLAVDATKYKQYLKQAQYNNYPYFGGGKAPNFPEKSLEHYLAAELLNLTKDDVYIDIAADGSPASEIYNKLYQCSSYKQDILFPSGIHGKTIGGDACNLPLPDGFATKIALHCSFEHFENDSDIKFIKEAQRVLKKGGKLCILPLYLFNKYVVQTNPAAMAKGGITFDKDTTLYCVKNWSARYGRFYDVTHLTSRITNTPNSEFKITLLIVQNEKQIDSTCYLKFIALFEKK